MRYDKIFRSSVSGLINYLRSGNLESMVLGVSGGIDSTVCAIICHEVTRLDPTLNFYGVSLPCRSNSSDELESARKVGKAFIGKNFWEHSFQEEFSVIEKWCSGKFSSTPLSQGNIKARLRMIYLRNLAGLKKGVVIDTDNLTEHNLGFFTIAGDQGDISPIAQLWKTEVYELANWLLKEYISGSDQREALELSMSLVPTDGNGVAKGGDLAQIAPSLKSYTELDEILKTYLIQGESNLSWLIEKYGEETVRMIIDRHKRTNFKRNSLPIILELDL